MLAFLDDLEIPVFETQEAAARWLEGPIGKLLLWIHGHFLCCGEGMLPAPEDRYTKDLQVECVELLGERLAELRERAGIDLPFLEQFKVFGRKGRRDKSTLNLNMGSLGVPQKIKKWFAQRFITVGYVALVDINQCNAQPDAMSESIEWLAIDKLPPLIYDHQEIILEGFKHIRHKINYLPIGHNLLPEKFTMKELQALYESILEKKLDRGNFQRKMLRLNFLIRHEKQMEGGAHKAPYLYSFDQEKYQALLDKGIGFVS